MRKNVLILLKKIINKIIRFIIYNSTENKDTDC